MYSYRGAVFDCSRSFPKQARFPYDIRQYIYILLQCAAVQQSIVEIIIYIIMYIVGLGDYTAMKAYKKRPRYTQVQVTIKRVKVTRGRMSSSSSSSYNNIQKATDIAVLQDYRYILEVAPVCRRRRRRVSLLYTLLK